MTNSLGAQSAVDRRMESRVATTGDAVFRPYGGPMIHGQVMDVSPGGIRIRYSGKRLKVGSEVDVLCPSTNPKATVAWTIRSGEWIQVGLRAIVQTAVEADTTGPKPDRQRVFPTAV